MRYLLAAGALALSAALLAPPTASFATAAGHVANEPHRPLLPTTTVRHAAKLAPGAAAPASITTTTTDADCSVPAPIAGPLGAGMVVTGTVRLDDVGDP